MHQTIHSFSGFRIIPVGKFHLKHMYTPHDVPGSPRPWLDFAKIRPGFAQIHGKYPKTEVVSLGFLMKKHVLSGQFGDSLVLCSFPRALCIDSISPNHSVDKGKTGWDDI